MTNHPLLSLDELNDIRQELVERQTALFEEFEKHRRKINHFISDLDMLIRRKENELGIHS